jgi:hypothetical protein
MRKRACTVFCKLHQCFLHCYYAWCANSQRNKHWSEARVSNRSTLLR